MSAPHQALARAVCALAAAALLVLLAVLLPPDDGPGPLWLRGLGRFHVLVLHLPIAFALLVPLLDAAGGWLRRETWRDTADLVLGLAFLGAAGAALLGILLAHGDCHQGTLVTWHLWLGVTAVTVLGAVWALRPLASRVHLPASLVAAGLVGWAAHLGGDLTHGERYLTESWSGRDAVTAAPPVAPGANLVPATVWQAAIMPIVERSCVSCHGPAKTNAGLRLDSLAGWRLGGKSELPCLVPGKPEGSELIRRIGLPADDDDVMPPDGKPLLKADEIALLRWWMAAGADPAMGVADARAKAPREVQALLASLAPVASLPVAILPPRSPPPVPVDGAWTVRWVAFRALAQQAGLVLAPVSTVPGDGLALRGFDGGTAVTGASLAALAPLAAFIVDADLGGTAVDDAGLRTIATWTNLRRCDLSRTRVTSAGLAPLAALPQLAILLLNGTAVDDAAVAPLRSCVHLRHLALCQTRLTPAALETLVKDRPACVVGSDAP